MVAPKQQEESYLSPLSVDKSIHQIFLAKKWAYLTIIGDVTFRVQPCYISNTWKKIWNAHESNFFVL